MADPIELFHPDLRAKLHDIDHESYPEPSRDSVRDSQAMDIRNRYAALMEKVVRPYRNQERETWFTQLQEADAWLANNSYPTPLLSAIAANRGIPLHDLVAKVKENNDTFRTAIGALLGQQQAELDALYQGE